MNIANAAALALALLCAPMAAHAQNVSMDDEIGPAYLIATRADRLTFMQAAESLPGARSANTFQLNIYYASDARRAGGGSVAWEDMTGAADCANQRLVMASTALYDENGRLLSSTALNQEVQAPPNSALATVLNIACTETRPQPLTPSSRRARLYAMRVALQQLARQAQQ